MPTRAAVFENAQIGIETTAGTSVPANRRLLATGITPRPRIPVDPFRPVGQKHPVQSSVQKEWTEAAIAGAIGYGDIIYLLSSLMKTAAAAGTWLFSMDPFAADVFTTYTVEAGSALGAEKFTYGFVSSLEMTFSNRAQPSLSGSMMGRAMSTGITKTASPTDVLKQIVDTKNVSVLVGDSLAGLTKINRCLEASWGCRNRRGTVLNLDSAQGSFIDTVELAPDMSSLLVLERDSVGVGYLSDLRSAATKFCRILAVSTKEYSVGSPYTLQITFPFNFMEPDTGERDNISIFSYPIMPIYDTAYGKAVEISVLNGIATL